MSYIGVDLHTNSFTACRLEADGSESFATYGLCRSDLDRFCLTLDADDEIALEATGNSAWFRDEVVPCAGRVVVVNPRRFRVIRSSVSKTDRNDARALALFLSKDMLPESRVKSVAESELASLTHTRDLLVKQRTRLINKIHALHVRHGIKLKRESLSSKRRLSGLEIGRFTALEQVELRVLRDQALALTEAIAGLDREVAAAAAAMSVTARRPTSWPHGSASCPGSASRTRPTIAGGSPNAATSWCVPRWCSAPSSPSATRDI